MATFTKQAIMRSFAEMLEEVPFDKITVSAISKRCGIGHNTFYYHFRDIYELLDQWLMEQANARIKSDGLWQDNVKAILVCCREHKKIVYHIFDSLARDHLERFSLSFSEDIILRYLAGKPELKSLSSQQFQHLSNFCHCAFFGYFLNFLFNNMTDDIESNVDELAVLLNGFAEDAMPHALS